jgi:spermidine synthase
MALDQAWFTEAVPACGTAFSLKLAAGQVKPLHREQTPYQLIEIYDTDTFGKLMVIDGCTMVSTRDNFLYHEMMAHPALFTHPDPKRVVIVGGGDSGTLKEVLKHASVEHALQVEIDERVTRLAEIHFPELCTSNHDPRAELYFGDGVAWMKNAKPGSVDVIIIDSTDPVGVAEGLFGKKFYADCIRALGPDGILVQQSESPLLHLDLITEMHAAMREVGFAQTQLISFPQPIYPSGWWSASLAAKNAAPLAPRLGAVNTGQLQTKYYSADMHRAAVTTPPFIAKALAGRG